MMKGVQYYRTRITDADGKRVAIYGLTREELYDRVEDCLLYTSIAGKSKMKKHWKS